MLLETGSCYLPLAVLLLADVAQAGPSTFFILTALTSSDSETIS